MEKRLLFFLLFLPVFFSAAQNIPVPLFPDITITQVANVALNATSLCRDRLTDRFYYSTSEGGIYELEISGSEITQSLIADSNVHGITHLKSLCVYDSVLYACGNFNENKLLTTGVIVKGILQEDGNRLWSVLARTEPYETADLFDHLFGACIINRTGDSIYISSGSRGDHGEEQRRGNLYKGIRNKAIHSRILSVPLNANGMVIPDDEHALDSLKMIICTGIRNTTALAYNGYGDLFATDLSGERDFDDELNWIRTGHHYGFPWIMGNELNPQQFKDYEVETDPLLNQNSIAFKEDLYGYDPSFPQMPENINFTSPCRNMGIAADHFRDSTSATAIDGSDLGIDIFSFTAHREPSGIVFDNDSVLAMNFSGDAFVTFFARGDSGIAGASPLLASMGDQGEDILWLELKKDTLQNEYAFYSSVIANGFNHPVALILDSNSLYLLEGNSGGVSSLWRITVPANPDLKKSDEIFSARLYPNPCNEELVLEIESSAESNGVFILSDFRGDNIIFSAIENIFGVQKYFFNISDIPPGIYVARIRVGKNYMMEKVVVCH
jgi:hypothetical protein